MDEVVMPIENVVGLPADWTPKVPEFDEQEQQGVISDLMKFKCTLHALLLMVGYSCIGCGGMAIGSLFMLICMQRLFLLS